MVKFFELYRQAFSGLSRDLWFLGLIAFVNRAGTMVLPFLTLYFTKRVGFSESQAGWFLLAFGAGSLTGSYLGGLLCVRWGSLRILTASLFLSGLGFLLFPLLHGFTTLAVACFVLALLADAFRPAVLVTFAEHASPECQTRAFAMLRLAVNVGMAVGPAAGGLLAAIDYSLIFIVDGVTCLLAAALVPLLFFRKIRAGAPDSSPGQTNKSPSSGPFRDGPFLVLLLLVLGLGMVIFQFFAAYPLYLNQHYGLSEDWIGFLFGLNALTVALVEMVVVHRLENMDPLRIFGLGCFLSCLGFALLPLGSSLSFALVCMAVFTLGAMLSLPFSNTLVALRAGSVPGPYMGIYSAVFSLAMMIGPPLGLYCFKYWGPAPFWYSLGGLGLLLWLGCVLLTGRFPKRDDPMS